jgi:hypothetical protein
MYLKAVELNPTALHERAEREESRARCGLSRIAHAGVSRKQWMKRAVSVTRDAPPLIRKGSHGNDKAETQWNLRGDPATNGFDEAELRGCETATGLAVGKPSDIPEFNKAIIELFAGGKARAKGA